MLQRILTAIAIAAVMILVLLKLPQPVVFGLLILIACAAAWEWSVFPKFESSGARLGYVVSVGLAVLAARYISAGPEGLQAFLWGALAWWGIAFLWIVFAPDAHNRATAVVGGWLVVAPAVVAFLHLYQLPRGPQLVLFLLILVWAADVGAFFSGRAFGRLKLAPRVSPSKTWEGLLGGVVVSSAVAAAGVWWFGWPALTFMSLCIAVVLISIVGDLTESMFKRFAGVKDSGKLLPGHGGMLDRFDSVMAAAPAFLLGVYWLEALP